MIAPMLKANLIVRKSDAKGILGAVQSLGICQLEKTKDDLECIDATEQSEEANKNLIRAKELLETLKGYHQVKQGMLAPKPIVEKDKLLNEEENLKRFEELEAKTDALKDKKLDLQTEILRAKQELSSLLPYEELDISAEDSKPEKVITLVGLIPKPESSIGRNLFEFEQAYVEVIKKESSYTALFAMVKREKKKEFLKLLNDNGFVKLNFEGNVQKRIKELRENIKKLEWDEVKLLEEFKKLAEDNVHFAMMMEDYFLIIKDKTEALTLLKQTKKTVVLFGFLKKDDEEAFENAVKSVTDKYYLEFEDATPEDNPPIALKNSKLAKPFEGIIELYAMPKAGTFDPAPSMIPIFSLFFGLMVSDAGYGILLMILSWLILKIKRPANDGMLKKVMSVVFIGGFATIFAGIFYGSIFGFEFTPLIVNPQKDPLMAIIFCLGIGVVSMMLALAIGAYVEIKRGNIAGAIFDKLTWMILLPSLIGLLLGGVISEICTYTALGSLVLIIFTNGRHKEGGIIKKFVGGIASLYGIVNYISDILSFSRLFGMGLATGVIAMVFNTIAGMLTGSAIGWVLAAIVFAIGHAFNIGINALGAYVHASRLMYIEMFPKYYEDGGRRFTPLRYTTKNYEIKN